MTQTDELTGLRSRRSLYADIDRHVKQAARGGSRQPITVLMLDVDFFKRVNDSYGHLVGSQTIREVANIIRDVVGTAERAARYGGEEYLAYLFGSREEGLRVAEEIRKRVEAHPFPASAIDPARTMRITISIGVATFPDDGLTALEIIQKADQALYRAKAIGRNQTCAYDKKLDRADAFRPTVDAAAIIHGPADAQ
ncbi:MAG TPA: GGDEF domain-containing protein [Blastocatellia bacterium]|nr:GGDEF domain-containing protein [Blastocatellia bacterium]